MTEPEFDRYAQDYDRVLGDSLPSGMNEDGYFAEYKVRLMGHRLSADKVKRVLDFGCGAGRGLPYLDKYFPKAELWGYDVSPASLAIAAGQAPRARLVSELPGDGTTFDAIVAANVFHHIPKGERLDALVSCRQLLAPGGSLFLFEHNPYNPVTRLVFERCPFDADAEMLTLRNALELAKLAGYSRESHGFTLFFPKPLAMLRPLENWLRWLPLGAQYFVQMAR